MNLDLEDSIRNCPSMQVFGSACRLSFKQNIYTKKELYLLREESEKTDSMKWNKLN